jgi:hypothetical protein
VFHDLEQDFFHLLVPPERPHILLFLIYLVEPRCSGHQFLLADFWVCSESSQIVEVVFEFLLGRPSEIGHEDKDKDSPQKDVAGLFDVEFKCKLFEL